MATLAELQTDLAAYKAARTKILGGYQSITVGGTTYTRATFSRIEDKIRDLELRIEAASKSGRLPMANPVFGGRR